MEAKDIIRKICQERGIDYPCQGELELVPLKDLSIHKREVWSLSITDEPELYFLQMDEKYKNKVGYYYKFPLADLKEGFRLCRELSEDFGTQPCEMSSSKLSSSQRRLFLVVHIHPEFKFTAKTKKAMAATQELVLNFI